MFVAALVFGCDGPPSPGALPEWTPRDHHSSDDDKLSAAPGRGARQARSNVAETAPGEVAQLVDVAWRQQCTSCHGPAGRGDGQMGPMVQAPDLTRTEWQARVTDADLLATIKNGKNRMPRFDMPEPVLRGLVARIRSLRAR